MRIRKRQVPLPLSSLIPVPLSDLYFNRSPAAPVQRFSSNGGGRGRGDDGDRGSALPQPSDRPDGLILRESINGCGFTDRGAHDDDDEKLRKDEKALGRKKEEEEEEESDAVASKNVDSGPETGVPQMPNSPAQVLGRLCHELEKDVPLKKRRGICFEEDNKGTSNAEMKTKMNKKCIEEQKGHDNVREETKSEAEDRKDGTGDRGRNVGSTILKGRKKARGSVLMEGSRCSRVNGRGWRCCQQTLVGYSLCEHHLGKGRLRSMTNVKKGHKNKEIRHVDKTNSGSLSLEEKGETGGGGDQKIAAAVKKRVKLGMVKARSISSLLGQTSSEIVAPADHHGDDDK